MKIIQFSLSAYILKANQIIAWHFFQPERKLTVTVLVGDSETGRHLLQTGYNDHLLRVTGQTRSGVREGCAGPWSPAETHQVSVWTMDCFKWDGGEKFFSFYYTRMWIKMEILVTPFVLVF